MADVKISALPAVSSSALSDEYPLVQGGVTKRATGTQIKAALVTGIGVADGGTGVASATAYSVLCGGTTGTGAFQSVSGLGTSGQVLTSNGAGALPTWQAAASPAGAALTKADDTNITLTLGGTPATALLQAASITAGWTGTLAVDRGGSGRGTATAYSVLCGGTTATGAHQSVSGLGTSGQVLTSNGAGALPTWQAAGAPAAAALTKGDDTNVTLTLGGTPATALLQAASITAGWTGTLAVGRGGTGSASASGARTALGVAIGSDVQAYNATLQSVADSTYTGDNAITTVGTITSGTWQGTTVDTLQGGTGRTSATAYAVICGGNLDSDPQQSIASVGTSGQVLTSNGAGALPTFQAAAGGGGGINNNIIIGGDFATNPFQRGTSASGVSDGDFVADRFYYGANNTAAVDSSQGASEAVDASGTTYFSDYALEIDVTKADTSIGAANYGVIYYNVEGRDIAGAGFGKSGTRNITLSFWHKHTITGTNSVTFQNSAADRTYAAEYTQSVADTWEKAEITIAVDTTGTWLYDEGIGLRIGFSLGAGAAVDVTAGSWSAGNFRGSTNQVNQLSNAANFFKLALVKLELGDTATDFQPEPASLTYQKCSRYYQEFDVLILEDAWNTVANTYVGTSMRSSTPTLTTTPDSGSGAVFTAITPAQDGMPLTIYQSTGNSVKDLGTVVADAEY